jgi:hypothetical protein
MTALSVDTCPRRGICRRALVAKQSVWAMLVTCALAGCATVTTSHRASGCSIAWTGKAANARWEDPRNWSNDQLPGAGDRVCVSAGSTVEVSGGVHRVASVDAAGRLVIRGGELRLMAGSSLARQLSVAAGDLYVGRSLVVTGGLAWTGGAIGGDGVVGLASSSVSRINPGRTHSVAVRLRTLENRGRLTWSSGAILGGPNTLVRNLGVLAADSPSSAGIRRISPRARFAVENLGTIEHDTSVGETTIDVPFDNSHMVKVRSGKLAFSDGSIPGKVSTGDFCADAKAGGIIFNGGDFHWADDIQMSGEIYMLRPARIWAGDIQAAQGFNPACGRR